MNANQRIRYILNDLVRVNLDRIEGYELAARMVNNELEAELRSLFYRLADQSREFRNSLNNAILRMGGQPSRSTTTTGDLYRVWMATKGAVSGNNSAGVLGSCEVGETAALRSYAKAIDETTEWPLGVSTIIETQYQLLQNAHETIGKFRDEYEVRDAVFNKS